MNKRISRFLVGAAIFSVVFMLSLFNINTFWCPTISSATTGKGNFRVNIEENISVAIESDMTDFEITPTPSGKFSSSNMIVRFTPTLMAINSIFLRLMPRRNLTEILQSLPYFLL